MNLKQRRVFYVSLIIIFAIIAPLIILYAAGYNFAIFERKIVKTGLLVLNSYPKNADIYLDNIITKKRTPINISNLTPREYEIKITKANYLPWQKKLNILPNTSIFADEINLFLKNPIKENYVTEYIIYSVGDDKNQKIALITETEQIKNLSIIDLNNKTRAIIKKNIDFEVNNMSWFKDNLILKKSVDNSSEYVIYDLDNNEENEINDLTNLEFDKIEGYDNEIFYGLAGDSLYKIDLKNKKIEISIKNGVEDFIINKNNILAIINNDEKTDLIELKENQTSLIENFVPKYSQFINLTDNIFILKNKDRFLLYSNNGRDKSLEIENSIISAEISGDLNKILYYNENEIWYYDLEEEKNHLINRQSGQIKNALWYSINDYVIYNIDNKIKATEIDLRDKRNEYTLYSDSSDISVHNIYKSKYLILESKKEHIAELFSLKIQ